MNPHRKLLLENISSLLLLQCVNYALPLITLPYLSRTLGIDRFGLVSFALAFIQYFVTLVDYGFNLTATRRISVNRDDPAMVSEIFCSVMAIKTALLVACFAAVCAVVFSVPKFRADWVIYLICFLAVFGNVLFPIWFYQGLERMKNIAVINAGARIAMTALLFVFVKRPGDYLAAALLQCLSVVIAGIVGLGYAQFTYPLRLIAPRMAMAKRLIVEGWPVFVSVVSSNVFGNINILILGIFYTTREVGYFSIAQRVVWALCYLVAPLGNAIYPRVGLLFKESEDRALAYVRKVLLIGVGPFALISAALFLAAPLISTFITGGAAPEIVVLIRTMAILPLCFFIDNILGTQIMLNRGMDRQYMKTFIIGGAASVVLAFAFIPAFSHIGASISQLLNEVLIIALMYFFVARHGIHVLAGARGGS